MSDAPALPACQFEKMECPTRGSGHRPIGACCPALRVRFGCALLLVFQKHKLTHHDDVYRLSIPGGDVHAGLCAGENLSPQTTALKIMVRSTAGSQGIFALFEEQLRP
ncbi:hypothetical protein X946_5213 [Burkholderia sp. ABCPW 111]|nr:hypothetical protein X946_5213 [Burkholderia sp. ABCPW 111]